MSLTGIARYAFAPRQHKLEQHFNEPEALQHNVLQHLLRAAANTEYGRNHLFATTKGYDDFVRNVPVNTYEELKADIDRMRHGEADVLWPGKVKWYAKSSGTTNDKSKFIPVSAEGLKNIHYKGGTDVVARLLKLKFPWLPIGNLVLIPDFVILSLAALVFGRVEAALYGLISLFVQAKVMDTVLYGMDTSKVAYIVTDRWKQVSDAILAMERGVTFLRGEGAFSGAEKHILMVAFKQKEIVQIKQLVHETDPRAFLIVVDARDVLGEGFGEYQKDEI